MSLFGAFMVLYVALAMAIIMTAPMWIDTRFGQVFQGCFTETRRFLEWAWGRVTHGSR